MCAGFESMQSIETGWDYEIYDPPRLEVPQLTWTAADHLTLQKSKVFMALNSDHLEFVSMHQAHLRRQALGDLFLFYMQDFDYDMVTFQRRYNNSIREQCNLQKVYRRAKRRSPAPELSLKQMRWPLARRNITHWSLGPRDTMRWKGYRPINREAYDTFDYAEADRWPEEGYRTSAVVEEKKRIAEGRDKYVRRVFHENLGGWEKRKMKPVVYAGDDATNWGRGEPEVGALDAMGEYQTQKRKERSELDIVIRGLTRAREHLLKHHDELKRDDEERRRRRDELTNRTAAVVTKLWIPNAGREFPPPEWEVLTDLITEVKGELGRFVDTENTVDEVRRTSWAAQDKIVNLQDLLKAWHI